MLTGKTTGNIPLGRPRHRRVNNVRMDLKEKGFNAWILAFSAHNRDYCRVLVNATLNLPGFIGKKG